MDNRQSVDIIHYQLSHQLKMRCGTDLRDRFEKVVWNHTHHQADGPIFLQIQQQPWILTCEQIIEDTNY